MNEGTRTPLHQDHDLAAHRVAFAQRARCWTRTSCLRRVRAVLLLSSCACSMPDPCHRQVGRPPGSRTPCAAVSERCRNRLARGPWSTPQGSNLLPPPCRGGAPPVKLDVEVVAWVRQRGVEPRSPAWKAGVSARYTSTAWWFRPGSHRTLPGFDRPLRCQSFGTVEPPLGVEPSRRRYKGRGRAAGEGEGCGDAESNRARDVGNVLFSPMNYHRSMEVHPGVEPGYRGLQPRT